MQVSQIILALYFRSSSGNFNQLKYVNCMGIYEDQKIHPGDLRSSVSPPNFEALSIGSSEYVKRCGNFKFSVRKITNTQGGVQSSCGGKAAVYCAFKQSLTNN